jgi:glutamate/tyrosine decarboxylase-like PLP-dependent enzyme
MEKQPEIETVTLKLSKYEQMRDALKCMDTKIKLYSGNSNLVKVTTNGFLGVKHFEFNEADKSVELINSELINENLQLKLTLKEKQSYWIGIEFELERLHAKINRLEWWKFWK